MDPHSIASKGQDRLPTEFLNSIPDSVCLFYT